MKDAPDATRLAVNFPELRQQPWRRLIPCLLITIVGSASLWMVLASLWNIWTTDALRSIGMFFPVVSATLTWQVWIRLGGETRGTWWGLLPLIYAVAAAHVADDTIARFAIGSRVSIPLIPFGLILFSYASGIILLFGGTHVWRQALFPLSLLLLVNPVPHSFVSFVDLPLQYISARTTRAFAAAIGVHLDGDQLRLMFAPEFGMFIAPGCNGIRGGISMGYVALVLGYLYRLSIWFRIIAVACAVALGYLFNLIRLCTLVLYYWVALRFHSMQGHAAGADYVIGSLFFLISTSLFVLLIQRKGRSSGGWEVSESWAADSENGGDPRDKTLRWKWLVSFALLSLAASPYIYGYGVLLVSQSADREVAPTPHTVFPAHLGRYTLVGIREDRESTRSLLYKWGSYSRGGQGSEIELGLWYPAGIHYPTWCHLARGEKPVWTRVEILPTADGRRNTFQLTAYDQGGVYLLEASTICTLNGCFEKDFAAPQVGVRFISPGIHNLIFESSFLSRPLLIRTTSTASAPLSTKQTAMSMADIADFVSGLRSSEVDQFVYSRDR